MTESINHKDFYLIMKMLSEQCRNLFFKDHLTIYLYNGIPYIWKCSFYIEPGSSFQLGPECIHVEGVEPIICEDMFLP